MKRIPTTLSFMILWFAGCIYCHAAEAPAIAVSLPAAAEQAVSKSVLEETPDRVLLTLPECYDLALVQSEIIAIDADRIMETEARFLKALSPIVPHLSFISADMQEANPNDAGSTLSTLKPRQSSQRRFVVQQTLFDGFKAFATMRQSRLEKDQRIKEKERAEQLLLVDVVNAFYLLIEKKEDIKALLRIRTALNDRIVELRKREDLGRSRPSEVVNAKAQLYNVEANLELVKNQQVLARQLLEFLVGTNVDDVIDTYGIPASLMPENYYTSKYVARPDVAAAEKAWYAAEKDVDIANGDFLPSVSVGGNYYVQRTGFNKGTDWDVTLTVTVPIFEGTEVLGEVQEAELKAHERKLEFMRVKRKAPYDIKDAYVGLTTALAVHDALRKAYSTAKLNYHLQKTDYERSLVNNLDVLASIQTLQNADRDYIHALYEAKRRYWALRVAVGESITESLYDTL